MNTTQIPQGTDALILKSISDAMTAAAEPIIQKALVDAEKAMRANLATAILSMSSYYNVQSHGQTIHITVDTKNFGAVPK